MSFFFPKNREKDGFPLDAEAINENFRDAYAETQSGLGEHNWRNGAILDRSKLEANTGIKIHRTGVALSHSIADGGGGSDPVPGAVGSNYYNVNPVSDWNVVIAVSGIAATMSRTITTGNSLLWIMGSFQQHTTNNARRYLGLDGVLSEISGCGHAISLDGTIIYESMDGGLDFSNDPTGTALRLDSYPFVVDTLIPVTAGVHTVSLEVRLGFGPSAPYSEIFVPTYSVATNNFYQIMSREFIILELR